LQNIEEEKDKVENFLNNNNSLARKGTLPYSVFQKPSDKIYFLQSFYKGRPSTIFFPYPEYINSKHDLQDQADEYERRGEIEELFLSFRISNKSHIYNALVNSMKNAGFELVD